MANIHSQRILGNVIFYDGTKQRWTWAVPSPDITQFHLDTAALPMAAADNPSQMTVTLVEAGAGETTVAIIDNTLLITADANENDGANIQVLGDAFDMATGNFVYFGIDFQTNDATQTDIFVGLAMTDTTLLGGVDTAAYFECLDGSTDINFVLEQDNSETTSGSAVGTLADDTNVILEFIFDGSTVDSWVNGVLQTRLATTNLPDDEQMSASIHFLTGEAVANTMTVNWWRAIQVNA